MRQRWGQDPEDLPNTYPAWDLEAECIAIAIADLIYTYSPCRIILGGGVSQHPGFHETTRQKVRKHLNGYIQSPMVADQMDDYIILPPALGNRSGGFGAIAMAIQLTVQMQQTIDGVW